MRILFLLVAFLIAYGSVYPFTVDLETAGAAEWREFLASWRASNSLGDMLGNIALFVPFGYLGPAALLLRHSGRRPAFGIVLAVVALGLIEAVGLQVAQIYLPGRVPKLSDAMWNGLGLAIGLGLALVPALRPERRSLVSGDPVPLLLIGLWVAYRLAPFVPSLDVQNVKDSLKPLLLTPLPIDWLSAAHGTAAWLACGALWRSFRGGRGPGIVWALAAMAAVFALEVLMVDNAVTSADVVGAAVALGAWLVVVRSVPKPEGLAALVLGVFVLASGLAPFALRPAPAPFEWLPFQGFLGGSMLVNVASLLEKLFNYGALIWLLQATRVPFAVSVIGAVGLAGGLEAAQTLIVGRTPEITDPLLALLIGVAIRLWRGASRPAGPSPSA